MEVVKFYYKMEGKGGIPPAPIELIINLNGSWINSVWVEIFGTAINHVLEICLHILSIELFSVDDNCHRLVHVYEFAIQINT